MQNERSYTQNSNGVKNSCDQYRNIKGVKYVNYTWNPEEFEAARAYAKENGLKTRIINGELYLEQK